MLSAIQFNDLKYITNCLLYIQQKKSRGFSSKKSGSILSLYGITLLRENVPLLPQLPQLPLTTTLIQQPLFISL
jgi:hypothetical protein